MSTYLQHSIICRHDTWPKHTHWLGLRATARHIAARDAGSFLNVSSKDAFPVQGHELLESFPSIILVLSQVHGPFAQQSLAVVFDILLLAVRVDTPHQYPCRRSF